MVRLIVNIVAGILAVLVVGVFVLWFVNRGPTISYKDLRAKWATPHSHYADLGGGVVVHYREDGPADAPAVILIHGYGDSHFSWEGWTPVLSVKYRTIAIDLPGHGLTEAPKTYALDLAALADLVAAVADKAGAKTFVVVGNSLGGGVAWQTALRHPDKVSGLILVDAAGWPPVVDPSKPKASPNLAFRIIGSPFGRFVLKHIDNKPLIRQGVRGEVGDPTVITDAFIDRWAEVQRAPGHRDILLDANLSGVASATPEKLAAIKVPTLIMWGEKDPIISKASADQFAKSIAGSQEIVYPGVGHLPQVEIPQRSAGDALAFIDAHQTK